MERSGYIKYYDILCIFPFGGAGSGKTEGYLQRSCPQGFALLMGHFVRGSNAPHRRQTRRKSSTRTLSL